MLHLSARFGLEKLTKTLLNLDSRKTVMSMLNNKGKTPQEIAAVNSHSQLSDDMDEVRE